MNTQPYRQAWTAQQDEWLAQLHPNRSNAEVAQIMARKVLSVRNRAVKLGLKKSPEYLEREKPGQFQEGHSTWNKGVAFDARGRSSETQFKAGGRPANTQPTGTEVTDSYGYRKRKVRDDAPQGRADKNWRFVHVLVWEEHNGPLPKGHIVRFRDLDGSNVTPGNLVAVSRAEHAVINRWMAMGELPEGGLDVLITMARIRIAARRREKELAA